MGLGFEFIVTGGLVSGEEFEAKIVSLVVWMFVLFAAETKLVDAIKKTENNNKTIKN
ncbi:hypothetical protein [Methanobacterium sp.]|uniref:hypothetical protein n=1 Tax=Methanobacterium sp. TaxID=2164 RepID=UPI003C792043